MQIAAKYGALTLIGLLISMPLVFWIAPNTGAGTTLLVVIVLLATNAIGGLLWRIRKTTSTDRLPTDSK
jgi:uncharacterized membrane protein YqjE